MENTSYINRESIAQRIKSELFQTLEFAENCNLMKQKQHERKLLQLMEQLSTMLCGNFYVETVKEDNLDFQLEREFLDQQIIGHIIVNMDKLSGQVCMHFTDVFSYLLNNFVQHTRRPLVETLENKGQMLLGRLCNFLLTNDQNCYFYSSILTNCCAHILLARKLVDLYPTESDDLSCQNIPLYVKLLESTNTNRNFSHLVQIFKFLKALLLSHMEVGSYACTRDLNLLVSVFNRLFDNKQNYYTRLCALELFNKLVQNRYLQNLIKFYTKDFDNLKLLYSVAFDAQANQRRQEYVKVFEILCLFYINPENETNPQFKQFSEDNYFQLQKMIDQMQHLRSYTNIKLLRPEYENVLRQLDLMANKADKNDNLRSNSRIGRFDSDSLF